MILRGNGCNKPTVNPRNQLRDKITPTFNEAKNEKTKEERQETDEVPQRSPQPPWGFHSFPLGSFTQSPKTHLKIKQEFSRKKRKLLPFPLNPTSRTRSQPAQRQEGVVVGFFCVMIPLSFLESFSRI